MKVLLTGSNGQLGRELTRQLEKKKIDHVGYDIPEFDVTDKEKIAAIIAKEQPTVIINCGALTNVDGCETQRDLAMAINAAGPKYLAEIARDQDMVLVQVSTDYVLSVGGLLTQGEWRPLPETVPVEPKPFMVKVRRREKKLLPKRHQSTLSSGLPGSMVMAIILSKRCWSWQPNTPN